MDVARWGDVPFVKSIPGLIKNCMPFPPGVPGITK